MKIPPKESLNKKDELLSKEFAVSVKTVQRWKVFYGLRNINKRLTDQEVEEIRNSKSTVRILAKKYNKTLTAIYRVKNNVTYKKGTIWGGSAEIG